MKELAQSILKAQEIFTNAKDEKTYFEAALEACERTTVFHTQTKAELVHILIRNSWVESCNWANKQIAK